MDFCLLGPVELFHRGERIELGPMKQRTVLAALLVNAGHPVGRDVVIDRVWGEQAPAQATNVLHTYIARLRGVLGRLDADPGHRVPRLIRQPAGYLLDVDPEAVDLLRFRSLADRARADTVAEQERERLLRQAIDLWRGESLAGCTGEWIIRSRDAWRLEHRDVVVRWARAVTGLGRGTEAVAPLEALIADFPMVEPVLDALMRALHAAGRDPEALDRYEFGRRLLAEELGVDPGRELQQLHQAILRGEIPAEPATPTAVAQLPTGVAGFVGRDAELSRLDQLLAAGRSNTAVISAVHGTAGVGKTTLAVHWARRVAHRFPDGQLYVDLRGFSGSGSAVSPATALQGFLEALGVAPQRVPADLDSRAAMFRSLLADRRMLMLLDNARDADQVRPLLPGAAGCLTLVTSRRQLTGLVAGYGAFPVSLDLLDGGEARRLVVGRIGAARAAAEPGPLREMIERCARLPLALAVLAGRIVMRPEVPLASMAVELRETRNALDALASDDPATDARTVFSWSYSTLSEPAARLFRLLGLQFGVDLGLRAVASLTALPLGRVRTLVRELTSAQLITEDETGRLRMHDLLRAYAAELVEDEESPDDRMAAEHRLLDHYLRGAHEARLRISRSQLPLTLPEAAAGVQADTFTSLESAFAWFAAEHQILLAAVPRAARAGLLTHAWQLGWAASKFLVQHGYWQEQREAMALALAAAIQSGDRFGEGLIRHTLAVAEKRLGNVDRAREELERAVRIHREIGDIGAEANAASTLGAIIGDAGESELALSYFGRAVELHRRAGNPVGEANGLNGMAWMHCALGRFETAIAFSERSLALLSSLDDPSGESATWHTAARAYHGHGRLDDARKAYERSLAHSRVARDRYHYALVLSDFGDLLRESGEVRAARAAWCESLDILVALNHDDAARVRRSLDDLSDATTLAG